MTGDIIEALISSLGVSALLQAIRLIVANATTAKRKLETKGILNLLFIIST